MNFEDEPYVRLYTRKTLTSKMLGWEGRVVLRMMIDEFDAAGIFEIRGDAATCISAVTDLPIEISRTGLARCLSTDTWILTGAAIVWPRHEHAQHCQRSDRMRQQESRRARAARALGSPAVTDVTPPVPPSQPVTDVTPQRDKSHPPYTPLPPPAPCPSTQSEGEPRAPEVPGLVVVYPGPLQPSKRERDLDAKAQALNDTGALRHEFTPGWVPVKANQARGHELGLTDDEIWARWETAKDNHFPKPFRSDVKQFNRELAFAAQDKKTAAFQASKQSKRDREAFELPGRERRAQ